MKAFAIQSEFGIDALALVDRPEPQPGPGEFVIKLRAASLNYRDLLVIKGQYNPKLRRPMIPVSDGVGEVTALGAGVQSVKLGERVAGTFMQRWPAGAITELAGRSALGGSIDGLLAEYAILNEEGFARPPAHLSDLEAAALPCAAVTAWNGLITSGKLQAGESVLIQGTGGVSLFALQFARLAGARVLAISSSDAKLERVRQAGATETINYRNVPDWEERVRDCTAGLGVDHVVEVGGAGTLGKSLRAVRSGGHISLIGVLTGGAGQVNPVPILMKNIRLQGIYVGNRAMFEAMNRAISLHQLRPFVDRVFAFAEARTALHYLESGAHFGKVCIQF